MLLTISLILTHLLLAGLVNGAENVQKIRVFLRWR